MSTTITGRVVRASRLSNRSREELGDPRPEPTVDDFADAMNGYVIDYAQLDTETGHADIVRYDGRERIVLEPSTTTMQRAVDAAAQMHMSARYGTGTRPDGNPVGVINAPTDSGVMIIRDAGSHEDTWARARAEELGELARAERHAAIEAEWARIPMVPVTTGYRHAYGYGYDLTVADAERIITNARGRIDITNDGMVITVPTNASYIAGALDVLYAAERHVIAWHKNKRKGSLPEQRVTPNGTLV